MSIVGAGDVNDPEEPHCDLCDRADLLEQGYARALQHGASDAKLMAFGPIVLDLLGRAAELARDCMKNWGYRRVEELIQAIGESGTKIVMTTHDLGQARRMADEVLFMHRGRVLEHGPAAAFFAGPKSAAAQAFLAGDLFW